MKAYNDIDLDPAMANIKLVQAFVIYYNVLKLHDPRLFLVIVQKHTQTHTYTQTQTHTQTNSDEYFILCISQSATIINKKYAKKLIQYARYKMAS